MKKLAILISGLSIMQGIVQAQDWQCVHDSATVSFYDTTRYISSYYGTNTLWVIHMDSVRFKNSYTYYYGFRTNRLTSKTYVNGTWLTEYCNDPYGPSRLGSAMSAGEAGNFFFNSAGDAIRICTLKQPGQAWICCRISDSSHLEAEVSATGVENVLGRMDSIKTISFQAKLNSGEMIDHPLNNKLFQISKRSGMLTLYDFYSFPAYDSASSGVHILSGIESPSFTAGDQNLTNRFIYAFAPGDVFHTRYLDWNGPHSSPPTTLIIHRVLDSSWNKAGDTVTYRISRFTDDWRGFSDFEHVYTKDTVVESYAVHSSACTGTDNFPEQTIFCRDGTGALKTVNSLTQYRGAAYNSCWVKKEANDFSTCAFCNDTLVGLAVTARDFHYWSSWFTEGCGGPYFSTYYTDWYADTYSASYSLVYF